MAMAPKQSEFALRGLMELHEIAAKAEGVSFDYLHRLTRGDRTNISRPAAEELEKATKGHHAHPDGICREAWVWPERHYNPYMWKRAVVSPGYCACCASNAERSAGKKKGKK